MAENMDTDMEVIVDAEDLIAEVEMRPALWDLNDEDYTNRDVRKQKWEEIVDALFKVEDATPEMKFSFGK